MKVYEIKEGGETTYFCHNGNKKEAKDWYVDECGSDENDIDSLKLFPRKKWKEVTIKYDEFNIEPFSTTIEEEMKGVNSPFILCSTAYL